MSVDTTTPSIEINTATLTSEGIVTALSRVGMITVVVSAVNYTNNCLYLLFLLLATLDVSVMITTTMFKSMTAITITSSEGMTTTTSSVGMTTTTSSVGMTTTTPSEGMTTTSSGTTIAVSAIL